MLGGRSLALALGALASAPAVEAQGILDATWLLDVRQGSARSATVRAQEGRGFELSGGEIVGFGQWYGTRWPDLHVTFLTQVSEAVGIVWGFSTGERGEKYRIDPGIKLGLLVSLAPTPAMSLSFGLSVQFGSDLSERACLADYGAVGGVQRVNCRLAATAIAPAETLRYRMRGAGIDDSRVSVDLEYSF